MDIEKIKSILGGLVFFGLLFGASFLWRKSKEEDIKQNSKYTIGEIIKKTGSLNSGEQWHYRFKFKGKYFEGYRSTHIDYNVAIGDYFLINFSSKNPDHSVLSYEYKLKINATGLTDSVWDTIPTNLFVTSLKK